MPDRILPLVMQARSESSLCLGSAMRFASRQSGVGLPVSFTPPLPLGLWHATQRTTKIFLPSAGSPFEGCADAHRVGSATKGPDSISVAAMARRRGEGTKVSLPHVGCSGRFGDALSNHGDPLRSGHPARVQLEKVDAVRKRGAIAPREVPGEAVVSRRKHPVDQGAN